MVGPADAARVAVLILDLVACRARFAALRLAREALSALEPVFFVVGCCSTR